MTTTAPPKVKYLTNKEILKEIHKSKNTFSSYLLPEYANYDIIVDSLEAINDEVLTEAKKNRATRLSQEAMEKASTGTVKLSLKDFEIDPADLSVQDLIFRVMTFDHIPLAPGRKKTVKSVSDAHEKVNFPPFQHWKFDTNDSLFCIGKSHWQGDVVTGHFSNSHGKMTDNLGRMFIKLCERYGTRGNVRGYTYNDEMRGQAILQLSQSGLKFDESKSNNPFAYYTSAITNSFVKVINIEKRHQEIRDDILQLNNLNPSFTRQYQDEWDSEFNRNN